MRIRPDKDDIAKAARMLLEAKNPLMSVGDEVTWCRAGKELVELAELLGLPVTGQAGALGFWSKPFPTRHPLYVGPQLRDMRYPGKPDVLLNLGNKYGERAAPGDAADLDPPRSREPCPRRAGRSRHGRRSAARHRRSDGGDPRAWRRRRGSSRSPRSAPPAPRAYTAEMREFRQKIARENADRTPVSLERIGLELEAALDKDTCYVCDVDSGKTIDPLMSFGGADKQYIGTGPNVLGWGMAAAFGVKLARPDLPVVSVVGDGSFCFSGPQPLWTQARYKAPVMNIVLNNHSYNNERNRIWHYGGQQFKTGRDMTCYLGSPDVDYAKASEAFGVEAEVVKEPGKLKGAIARAQRAIADGRPYLPGRSHLSRRRRRGLDLASAVLGRGPALEEGVTMQRLAAAGALAALVLVAATPLAAQTAGCPAARRRPRPRRDRLLAMPQPERPDGGPRRAGRMEATTSTTWCCAARN